ncbi:helix-turn-helix domain-containing protein [Kriegella aquimaris]|nr:helix-turn-helix domain-containing protein [Kriegella aquimaris]
MKFDEYRHDLKPYGLTCELWRPSLMKRPDRHNEIEINYLPECSITYLIHNRKFRVKKGSTMVFWALMPHQIVEFDRDAPYYVITVPFSILHEWKLPKAFLDVLFKGEMQAITHHFEDAEFDKKRFEKWTQELEQEDEEIYAACLLEFCAYLKRFAVKSLSAGQCLQKASPPSINLVERIAMYIASKFTDPIKVCDVAKEVGVHPDYANTIFKKAFNCTISNYIMEQRVLYAQRKLAFSTESITSLAYQSGFNSISRFNAAFKKKNIMTPREYRKKHLLA